MKTLIWTLTGLAVVGILLVGASKEITLGAGIIAALSLGWLGYVAFVIWRYEHERR